MSIPSLSEIVGIIVTAVVVSVASGHGDLVVKELAALRRVAIASSRQDWGCPSLWGKSGCRSYHSQRYR